MAVEREECKVVQQRESKELVEQVTERGSGGERQVKRITVREILREKTKSALETKTE